MRIIDETKGCASLFTRTGKKLLATTAITAVGLMAFSNMATANNWTNTTDVEGNTTTDTSVANTTGITIDSGRAVIEGDLDIDAGWEVNVGAGDLIAIDNENDPTFIFGKLNCAGSCHVVDRNGVIVGDTGSVDANAIVLTDGDVMNQTEFMNGSDDVVLGNFSGAGVTNNGSITAAEGGLVGLVSPRAINNGNISAKMGTVVMAAGETVTLDLYGDGLVEVAVDGKLSEALLQNTGEINARGGNVIVKASVASDVVNNVINMDGIVNVGAVSVQKGKIVLDAGKNGNVRVGGTLQASGSGRDAGDIQIKGKKVTIAQDALVLASANNVNKSAGEIDIDAKERLIINGRVRAMDLALGEGVVKTSAPRYDFGRANPILASREWIMKTDDIIIRGPIATALTQQLNGGGDMTVKSRALGDQEGNITLASAINSNSDNALNLVAANKIQFKAGAGSLSSNGGDITLKSGGLVQLRDGTIDAQGGDIKIKNEGAFFGEEDSLNTSGEGTISLNQNKSEGFNAKIQNAIDAINNTGTGLNTVNVGAGNWNEAVVADVANLHLKGANAGVAGNSGRRVEETTIVPNSPGFEILADDVTIDGFKIVGGDNGVESVGNDRVTVINNIIEEQLDNGVSITGGTDHEVSENMIRYTGADGVNLQGFGNAWVSYNDISFTGKHGVHAIQGDFVSVYDNYISFAGFELSEGENISTGVGHGVFVGGIRADELPGMAEVDAPAGFGVSKYGMNAEVYGNEIAITAQDGVNGYNNDSLYVADNIIGHTGDAGVDSFKTDVAVIRDNAISSTRGNGIVVDDARYAGIFDNRVLLAGINGIHVGTTFGGQDAEVLGDVEYGYGWSVNVSGNEVALTGQNGIEVIEAGPTKVADNKVFMAGMGVRLQNAVQDINGFASNPPVGMPPVPVAVNREAFVQQVEDAPESFTHNWGDGHGIYVAGITGAGLSPTGFAADVTGNVVKYTGGHGISVVESDRTRIDANKAFFAGIDSTTMSGTANLLGMLNDGPFGREDEGRRDLWQADASMVNVLEEYFGQPYTDEPVEGPYITIENVKYDNFDGINAENIYNSLADVRLEPVKVLAIDSNEYSADNENLFALEITGNTVRVTGDDGVEVNTAGRTLIEGNTIRDAGHGDNEDYGAGGFEGADGIRVRNVTAGVSGNILARDSGSIIDDEPVIEDAPYNYEPDENYALVIRGNDIKRTGDDGIEVMGSDNLMTVFSSGERSGYNGTTDRVLIAENRIREAGYSDAENEIREVGNEEGLEHGYNNVGPDGFGHDGIHVRNVSGTVYEDVLQKQGPGGSYNANNSFYGYSVDLIANDIAKTGDDGAEVLNSESTLIINNTIRQSGVYWDDKDNLNTDGADYYGADGIHVRNVGGANPDYVADGYSGPSDFEPYSVAIVGNDVRRTADDGIEVVGENEDYDNSSSNNVSRSVFGDYDGTGRTLILDNVIRNAGVSGYVEETYESSYDSETGSSFDFDVSGNQGAYDNNGGDGISIRGIGGANSQPPIWWPVDIETTAVSSGSGNVGSGIVSTIGSDYDVKIIGNDVRKTGDDGIEVAGDDRTESVLVELNTVRDAGLSGGLSEYTYSSNNGTVDGEYFSNRLETEADSIYGNAGRDGRGADGIHISGVSAGNNYDEYSTELQSVGNGTDGYYGYAVDVFENDVKRTGDDGIEVRDSSSTLLVDNKVDGAGSLTSRSNSSAYNSTATTEGSDYINTSESIESTTYTGGDISGKTNTGGDGIFVENVGSQNVILRSGDSTQKDNFEPYAVVIKGSEISNSSDDAIEVLFSGRTRIEANKITHSGEASVESSGTTTQTSSGENDPSSSSSSSSSFSGFSSNQSSTTLGALASDGRGADGIHVSDVYYEDEIRIDQAVALNSLGGTVNPEPSEFSDALEIIDNEIDYTADDGIQVIDSGNTLIQGNKVADSGEGTLDGIFIDGPLSPRTLVAFQDVEEVEPTTTTSSYSFSGQGEVDATGGDGINVGRDNLPRFREGPIGRPQVRSLALSSAAEAFEIDGPATSVRIIDNVVVVSKDDGIEVIGASNDDDFDGATAVLIDRNLVGLSGDNGLSLVTGSISDNYDSAYEISLVPVSNPGSPMYSEVVGNEFKNSGSRGIYVGGPSHEDVIVSDNLLLNNPIGAEFESGLIDLTGEGNIIEGGETGLRFSPVIVGFERPEDEFETTLKVMEVSGVPIMSALELVDNTVGAQTFDGQTGNYIELDNGAFFDPGQPTQLSLLDSTFVDTPFGTFTPSVDFIPFGGFPSDVKDFLESKVEHFPDDETLGEFFLPELNEVDQEDIFRFISQGAGQLSGLNLRINGLPGVAGGVAPTATNLNNITPAAGGTSPEDLNNIETAAGGDEGGPTASCYSDAFSFAEAGQAVNVSYSGGAAALLESEASCGL